MVTYPVYLVSFRAVSEPIKVRLVHVPGDPLPARQALDLVYRWGQNDFQPMSMRSVSVGDVIVVEDVPYLVLNVGFREMTPTGFEAYKRLDRDLRFRCYGV
jgi:hypothetical protein